MAEKEEKKWVSVFKEYASYIVVIIIVLLFKRFIVSPIKVNGDSMLDTLQDGDIMILNIIGYRFEEVERFDIVVIDSGKEYLIKRVIGMPGEKVEYNNNELYINGKKMEDPYGSNQTDDFSVEVPEGSYYVLGDNRNNSLDSRYFGPFSKKEILGKTKLTIFPFKRIGNKE